MENNIKDGNYFVVQSFMVKELKLKGLELIIYAVIYGFSQSNQGVFRGSLQYLCDWSNSTKQGVLKALKCLVDKGLICKSDIWKDGVKFVEYHATQFNGVLNSVEQGIKLSLTEGSKLSLPNNISLDNNKDIIKDNKVSQVFDPDTKLNEVIIKYIEYRKSIGKKMSDYSIQLMLKKLENLSSNNDEKIQILEQSIMNGWTGIFPIKDETGNRSYGQKQTVNDLSNMLSGMQGGYE